VVFLFAHIPLNTNMSNYVCRMETLQYYGGDGFGGCAEDWDYTIKHGEDLEVSFDNFTKAKTFYDSLNEPKAFWDDLRGELLDAWFMGDESTDDEKELHLPF
jgi:hypothetical protein